MIMNSNIVKPEKFGHLHLVDHFTVPLNIRDTMPLYLLNNFFSLKFCLKFVTFLADICIYIFCLLADADFGARCFWFSTSHSDFEYFFKAVSLTWN